MNKVETFYADSIYDLENKIGKFSKRHNIIGVTFYDGESNFVRKRAMVIFNDN